MWNWDWYQSSYLTPGVDLIPKSVWESVSSIESVAGLRESGHAETAVYITPNILNTHFLISLCLTRLSFVQEIKCKYRNVHCYGEFLFPLCPSLCAESTKVVSQQTLSKKVIKRRSDYTHKFKKFIKSIENRC